MRKTLIAATVLAVAPLSAHAQNMQYEGFYAGAVGGLNWLLSNSTTTNFSVNGGALGSAAANLSFNTGWAAGGMVGYDFVGPRVELEGMYRENTGTINFGGVGSTGLTARSVAVMGNVLYDFNAGGVIVPYIGAGAGVAFTQVGVGNQTSNSTQFAYQGILGLGWNVDPQFRVNLEGRYFGTTNPNYNFSGFVGGNFVAGGGNYSNSNFSVMASLQLRFGAPAAAPPPPPPRPVAPSFMVFFDWDRSNLSQQALNTIKQAANAYKTKGNARITATGHTDTSGPEAYNMALSLRRANSVKDALVRDGVPATAISVIGRGEAGLLVQTPDGVREPQNRRVEIVIQ